MWSQPQCELTAATTPTGPAVAAQLSVIQQSAFPNAGGCLPVAHLQGKIRDLEKCTLTEENKVNSLPMTDTTTVV